MTYTLRDYRPTDADALNRVALLAFQEFEQKYDDWDAVENSVSKMSELSSTAELIVATVAEQVMGGVAYVPPGVNKKHFPTDLPCVRMLVVDPKHRGQGLGRTLAEACIARARRDKAPKIGLHTSPIMEVALPLYLRLGFVKEADIAPIRGVAYAVYYKSLR